MEKVNVTIRQKTLHVLAVAVTVALLIPVGTEAASKLTFDNKSGKPALVKLVGPTASSVSVENSKKESVSVVPGHYFIKIRYGSPGAYSYSKGEEFDVTETATTSSEITITLHKVVDGNYSSQSISEGEFGAVERTSPLPPAVIETNCVVATATSKAQKELDIEVPPAWTNDWTAFVKELKKEIKKDNYYVNNVNIAFLGKSVVWTGTVKEIRRPPNERPFPSVDLSMKSEDLGFASGKTTLDSLSLQPEGDEWNTWQNVSVGDKVVFRTTLDVFPYVSPKCVFSLMVGVGSGAGTNIAWISAKGGVCLKSEPSRKQ